MDAIGLERSQLNLGPIRYKVSARTLTTICIGGAIERLAAPEDVTQLRAVLSRIKADGDRFKILGAGSNLLLSDHGIKGWVIKLGRGFRGIDPLAAGRFKVGAAHSLMLLSRELSEAGFSGLEFAGGIPASLGGATFMNAGAHASEMSQVIERVYVLNEEGEEEVLNSNELKFSYRYSGIANGKIITAVELKLACGDKERIKQLRIKNLEHRKAAQPLQLPSAGSVFKNPKPDLSAWQLIERLGLKGRRLGGAEISNQHANWIVNPSRQASAADVMGLIELCKAQVKDHCALELESEIIYWDE